MSTPLHQLFLLLSEDMNHVNALMLEGIQSHVALIPKLANHLTAAGGKRIRPLLALAVAGFFENDSFSRVQLAACVEFIHTATLLHDDVVDGSATRRGNASANAVWGNKVSVLVGDFLFARAFKLMVAMQSFPVLEILSSASAMIAEGEVMQLLMTQSFEKSAQNYLLAIEAKTAKLFEATCEAAAHLSQASADISAKLRTYGRHLGIAFQMVDDILDYTDTLEKQSGIDFSEGKITLPVLIAWEKSTGIEKEFWIRTMQNKQQLPGDFQRAFEILKTSGAFQAAKKQAAAEVQKAIQALQALPKNPMRRHLEALAQYTVERTL